METKSPSGFTNDARNAHFQSWIVISMIFDCGQSGPAQESIILIIGSFWGKRYR